MIDRPALHAQPVFATERTSGLNAAIERAVARVVGSEAFDALSAALAIELVPRPALGGAAHASGRFDVGPFERAELVLPCGSSGWSSVVLYARADVGVRIEDLRTAPLGASVTVRVEPGTLPEGTTKLSFVSGTTRLTYVYASGSRRLRSIRFERPLRG